MARRRPAGRAARGRATTTSSGCTSWSGSTVVLADGNAVGTVTEVESNPAADLLVLDSGALVPVVFITAHEHGRVTIDPPEGLFDL